MMSFINFEGLYAATANPLGAVVVILLALSLPCLLAFWLATRTAPPEDDLEQELLPNAELPTAPAQQVVQKVWLVSYIHVAPAGKVSYGYAKCGNPCSWLLGTLANAETDGVYIYLNSVWVNEDQVPANLPSRV